MNTFANFKDHFQMSPLNVATGFRSKIDISFVISNRGMDYLERDMPLYPWACQQAVHADKERGASSSHTSPGGRGPLLPTWSSPKPQVERTLCVLQMSIVLVDVLEEKSLFYFLSVPRGYAGSKESKLGDRLSLPGQGPQAG